MKRASLRGRIMGALCTAGTAQERPEWVALPAYHWSYPSGATQRDGRVGEERGVEQFPPAALFGAALFPLGVAGALGDLLPVATPCGLVGEGDGVLDRVDVLAYRADPPLGAEDGVQPVVEPGFPVL